MWWVYSFVFACLLIPNSAFSLNPPPSVAELIEVSRRDNLSANRAWETLLHYERGQLFGRIESLVEAPEFFISPTGKTDPESEVEAAIAGFFGADQKRAQELQCKFPARFHWLREVLKLDLQEFPKLPCPEYDDWLSLLSPSGITLIFPSEFLNNPASSFGHTLVRIDHSDTTTQTGLISHAANFAAATEDDSAIIYALKGLFGGYDGYFSVSPYYERVNLYNDLESRDIWEYKLNFTQAEVLQLVRHLWEVRGVPYDYFYFDENCSYQLLALFEVARPSLSLKNRFKSWAIPVDTVRVILDYEELLGRISYRPSITTKLRAYVSQLPQTAQQAAKDIANDPEMIQEAEFNGLSLSQKKQVLDLAYDYLNYEILAGKRNGDEARQNAHKLLLARSTLVREVGDRELLATVSRPDRGHLTSRFRLTAGREEDKWYGELTYRPAYHELLDPQRGYGEGSQLNFFEASARLTESSGVRLEKFFPLDLVSLSARNLFLKPLSWRLKAGVQRKSFEARKRPLVSQLQGGAGITSSIGEGSVVYGLVGTRIYSSGNYRDDFSLGLTGEGGVLIGLYDRLAVHGLVDAGRYFAGDEHNEYRFRAQGRLELSKEISLRLEYVRSQEVRARKSQFLLSLDYFL